MSAALAIINAEHDAVRTVGDRRIHVKAGQQIRAADGVVLARKPTKPQN